MSLLPFWALNVVVVLLSMEGQKALGFNQKYLNLCSEDEQRFDRVGGLLTVMLALQSGSRCGRLVWGSRLRFPNDFHRGL